MSFSLEVTVPISVLTTCRNAQVIQDVREYLDVLLAGHEDNSLANAIANMTLAVLASMEELPHASMSRTNSTDSMPAANATATQTDVAMTSGPQVDTMHVTDPLTDELVGAKFEPDVSGKMIPLFEIRVRDATKELEWVPVSNGMSIRDVASHWAEVVGGSSDPQAYGWAVWAAGRPEKHVTTHEYDTALNLLGVELNTTLVLSPVLHLKITIVDGAGNEKTFKLRDTEPFSIVAEYCASKSGVSRGRLQFEYNNNIIQNTDEKSLKQIGICQNARIKMIICDHPDSYMMKVHITDRRHRKRTLDINSHETLGNLMHKYAGTLRQVPSHVLIKYDGAALTNFDATLDALGIVDGTIIPVTGYMNEVTSLEHIDVTFVDEMKRKTTLRFNTIEETFADLLMGYAEAWGLPPSCLLLDFRGQKFFGDLIPPHPLMKCGFSDGAIVHVSPLSQAQMPRDRISRDSLFDEDTY